MVSKTTTDCDALLSDAWQALFKARLTLVQVLHSDIDPKRFEDVQKLQLSLSEAQDKLAKIQQ